MEEGENRKTRGGNSNFMKCVPLAQLTAHSAPMLDILKVCTLFGFDSDVCAIHTQELFTASSWICCFQVTTDIL